MHDFYGNKKILITGATGIIGLHLTKSLSQMGAQVTVNHVRDMHPSHEVFFDASVTRRRFDVEDSDAIAQLEEYDMIFHCAGYGQPKKFVSDPLKTFHLNTVATEALIQKVKPGGHFFFVSSSELYVNSVDTDEATRITIDQGNIRNCYILGKLCGEMVAIEQGKKRCVSVKIGRQCLGYGPGFKKDDNRVLYELIAKAVDTGEIALMDDGSALRNYIYITDAIAMMLAIMERGTETIYNIGGTTAVSIRDVATIIGDITGARVIVGNKENALAGSPAFAGVSIARYEKEFGTPSFTDMRTGIAACVEWYKTL